MLSVLFAFPAFMLIFIGLGVKQRRRAQMKRRTATVRAEVVDIVEHGDTVSVYHPVLRFGTYRVQYSGAIDKDKVHVGDEVDVLYNPHDLSDCEAPMWLMDKSDLMCCMCLASGAFLLMLSALVAISM